MKHYRHLSKKDRKKISRMKSYGWSCSRIAKLIGVDKSTISRELRRNGEMKDRDLKFWKKLYLDLGLFEEYEQIKDQPDNERFLSYEAKYAERRAEARSLRSVRRAKIKD